MLIAFEGGEGSGKSTQARIFADRLGALLTREPGGTPVGERIRALVLDPALGELDARAEALLMAAARAQHATLVIAPALRSGRTVVTDRYRGSSLAYQGYGRGLPLEQVAAMSDLAGAPEADVVVLLSMPASVAAERLNREGGTPDRIEAFGRQFHAAVAQGFAALAAADPERWVVVDGAGTVEEVAARVWTALQPKLESAG